MSNRCPRPLAALVASVYLGVPGFSQSSETSTIRGELHSDALVPFHEYCVELASLNHPDGTHRVAVQFDGSFQLRDMLTGEYTLRFTTLHGELVHQESVSANPQAGPLTVRLPAFASKPSAPGTISVTQLRHPPAQKALRAVVAAQRFSAAGQTEKAVEELERAAETLPSASATLDTLRRLR